MAGRSRWIGVAPAAVAAALNSPPVRRALRKTRIVSTLGGWINPNTQKSNGTTQLSGTDKVPFAVFSDACQLQFLYANGYQDSSGQINPVSNALNIRAAIDSPTGNQALTIPFKGSTASPIASGGKTATAVPDQGWVISEPIGYLAKSSGTYQVRTHKVVASGEFWPMTGLLPSGSKTTDIVYGTTVKDGSDASETPAAAMGSPAANAYGFFPVAVLGQMLSPVPVALICGDSIAAGQGATTGYLQRAFAGATGWGYHTDACGGVTSQALAYYGQIAFVLSAYADTVVWHITTNDMSSGVITSVDSYKSWMYSMMGKVDPSCAQWVGTVLPRTGSSDNWATATNQTPPAWEVTRVAVNNFIRDTSSAGFIAWARALGLNIGGVYDPCLAVEVNSDNSPLTLVNGQQVAGTGGRWLTNGTGAYYVNNDGIHPTDNGNILMAAVVPVDAMRTAAGF